MSWDIEAARACALRAIDDAHLHATDDVDMSETAQSDVAQPSRTAQRLAYAATASYWWCVGLAAALAVVGTYYVAISREPVAFRLFTFVLLVIAPGVVLYLVGQIARVLFAAMSKVHDPIAAAVERMWCAVGCAAARAWRALAWFYTDPFSRWARACAAGLCAFAAWMQRTAHAVMHAAVAFYLGTVRVMFAIGRGVSATAQAMMAFGRAVGGAAVRAAHWLREAARRALDVATAACEFCLTHAAFPVRLFARLLMKLFPQFA